jgi:hypothetical protein
MPSDYLVPGVSLPPDATLPFFAYGALKPGEIGHSNIHRGVQRASRATFTGTLYSRDGMALLTTNGPHAQPIEGALITFRDPSGYEAVSDYEPVTHYRWAGPVRLTDPEVEANVLVGIDPGNGGIELETAEWSSRSDPAFSSALDVIDATRRREGTKTRQLIGAAEWRSFFRTEAAYLLLWSVVERYASLAFSPRLRPEAKVDRLSGESEFVVDLRHRLIQTRPVSPVYDARDPGRPYGVDDPVSYLRAIRHNLTHRGKAAWRDDGILRTALAVLLPAFRNLLLRRLPS